MDKKLKIGVVCINLNPPYWQFASEMLWGLDTFFLKHKDIKDKYETEFMIWSDIPESEEDIVTKLAEWMTSRGELKTSIVSESQVVFLAEGDKQKSFSEMVKKVSNLRKRNIKIFPTEPIEWPMPTLMRYHLFLQQEEYLRNFDFIFYIDVDMRITDWIGEEILGDGLTAALHPMYALRRNYQPPYEPNPNSKAYIPRPGRLMDNLNDKGEVVNRFFEPLYYAGGFQGGKTEDFIKAMKVMRKNIDDDFGINYVAIWNDETHWNRYLFEVPPVVVLNPSYIYPDSLVADYYVRLWGRNYSPKIMTLTKAFSTSQSGGEAVRKMMAL